MVSNAYISLISSGSFLVAPRTLSKVTAQSFRVGQCGSHAGHQGIINLLTICGYPSYLQVLAGGCSCFFLLAEITWVPSLLELPLNVHGLALEPHGLFRQWTAVLNVIQALLEHTDQRLVVSGQQEVLATQDIVLGLVKGIGYR